MKRALAALARGSAGILGRPLTESEQEQFVKYIDLLEKWQKSHRLVGSSEPMWIVEHLLLDSLLFLKLLPLTARTVLDLGSGAGLPGLPLKIVRSDLDMTLAESRRRRASFLAAAIRELGLQGVRVVSNRLEDRDSELAGRFDAVVTRCAGDVNELIPVAARLTRRGGVVIAAGPPESHELSLGDWVVVPGLGPGRTRRFLLHQIS
jgi:16S rRNA (guanine527-N7)-methyltransferase